MFSLQLTPIENLIAAVVRSNPGAKLDASRYQIVSVRGYRGVDVDTLAVIESKVSNLKRTSDRIELKYCKKDIRSRIPERLLIPAGHQRNTSDLIYQLSEIYGLKLTDSDITVEPISVDLAPMDLSIRLREDHPIWTGSIDVRLGPPSTALASLITQTELDVSDDDDRLPAELIYFGMDFTSIKGVLEALSQGQVVDKAFRSTLNSAVHHVWGHSKTARPFNLMGGEVKFAGKTADCPYSCNRQLFENVVILSLSSLCVNYKGHLVLHYR